VAAPRSPLSRDFRRYWAATTISMLGSQLSLIAFPLLVLSIGGSAARAGLLGTASLVTRLVFRLPAGQLADRVGRRRLMLVTDLVRFAALASVPVVAAVGRLTFGQLVVAAVVEGVASAFFGPAASVAVRDVVPAGQLTAALSRVETSAATTSLVGPIVGGWLFGIRPELPFTLDAASYLVSAVLILGLPMRAVAFESDAVDRALTAGLRWIGRQPALMRALLFGALINLAGSAAETGVVLALRTAGRTGLTIGLLLACAGAGAVAGAMLAPAILARLTPGRLFVVVGVSWTAGFGLFTLQPAPAVVGATLVVLMVLTPATGIVLSQALLSAPRDLLGRVSTAVDLGTAGLASVGPVLVGVSLQIWGLAPMWATLAGLTALATVAGAVPLRRSVTLVRPGERVAPEPAAELVTDADVLAHRSPEDAREEDRCPRTRWSAPVRSRTGPTPTAGSRTRATRSPRPGPPARSSGTSRPGRPGPVGPGCTSGSGPGTGSAACPHPSPAGDGCS
jgi:MFS family permease